MRPFASSEMPIFRPILSKRSSSQAVIDAHFATNTELSASGISRVHAPRVTRFGSQIFSCMPFQTNRAT
ncbi:hypothetical protein FVE85_6675 [Porphyridium purpureum]|uniref:Uncharacterized protein n=1 Tax=Porphyridium purpureum TaxID=35688 RepID=A0A5J4Z8U7_PORPP|nr:hypothetical protein FVE85_6672 [Porphyridium purpureum]KAA8499090.1 hypothetical protein FVE85_6675 [Porphyridium purpureum]|eukprot:POR4596..scf295_1